MSLIKNYRELDVYQNAMRLAMRLFELTRTFPAEKKYSLTDQIRRSSRSVCANLAEAWRKRRYEAAFTAKLSDSETEAAETQVQAEIAWYCGYVTEKTFHELDRQCDQIMGQIVRMMEQPEKWLIRPSASRAGETGNRRVGGGAGETAKRGIGERRHPVANSPSPRLPVSSATRTHNP